MRRIFLYLYRNSFSFLLFLFLFQFGAAGAVFAATLQKYREDIKQVTADLSSMYSLTDEDFGKEWSRQDQLDFENRFFTEIPTLLPPQETVEWQGMQVEVDNRWLHTRLEDLKKLSISSTDRDPIVTELCERLAAIDAKLKELEPSPAGVRSKDEEKQKLAQILNRAEYQAPEKQEKSALQRWWDSFTKWLQGLFPEPKPLEPMEPLSGPAIAPGIVLILIIGIALAVVVFVIWRFAPVFRNRRRLKKEKKEDERIILGERLAADESSVSLFEQAELMAREGNFRGAIRKGYIALLCELGDRKIVRLAQYKTNRDYLRDVSKNKELHHGVRELTSIFENHWYGLETASEEEWGAFRENYRYSTNKL